MRGHRRRGGRARGRRFHGGDAVLDGLLDLLERSHLDLAHAFARYAEFHREVLKSHRLVGKPARLEDAPFTVVEHLKRIGQRRAAIVQLLRGSEGRFLAITVVHQPVLPLARITVLANRSVERSVAAEPPVHVDDVLLGHAEPLGYQLDLIGAHIPLVQRGDSAFGLAQVEEELFLVGGGAHLDERPRPQNVFLNGGFDPPHRVGGEAEAFLRFEALHRLHQADIALRNHFGNRKAIAPIAHGDFGNQPQVAGHELVSRNAVAMLPPALGQHIFFPMLEPQEEYMLAKRWREHGDRVAAHKLVTSHLRLVAKIAMGYRGYCLPIAEVISEGNVGLMQAVKRFEPEKGFRLATYAMWWIKAAIQEYILRSWSLVKMGTTANQKKLFFNLRKAKSRISALDEGDMRPDQVKLIAKRLGVTEQDVIDMNRRLGGDVSLNAPIRDDGDSGEWQDWLVDEVSDQESRLAESEGADNRRQGLGEALSVLNEREPRIFEARRMADDPNPPE